LKPEYRLALARDGYALVKCEHAVFNPEQIVWNDQAPSNQPQYDHHHWNTSG